MVFVLLVFVFSLWSVFPLDSERFGREGLTLGLDLKGGSYLVYQADLTKKDPGQTDEEVMKGVISKIERRVNSLGVTEPIIQQQGTDRLLVEMPGVANIEEAVKIIGQVAELDFREAKYGPDGKELLDDKGNLVWEKSSAIGSDNKEKFLTGKYLKPNSQPNIDEQTGQPEVLFSWNEEGAILFEKITTRCVGKRLGIFLDDQLISAPIVQTVIKDSGRITGVTLQEAQNLAILLNSGSLDVPLKIIQQQDIDATLGSDSVHKSLIAGIIGLILVAVFMVFYYRVPGFVACLALGIYGIVLLMIFKLVPITLTLPGLAAFIVSFGMAVDANVLIFERMKEELRGGRTLGAAVEAGFKRAWTAIRDSNITTFIACIILLWFGDAVGAFMVKGFALTLLIGVALSMISALTVTRVFMRFVVKIVTSISLYGVRK